MYHPFSIRETIQSAWQVIRENFLTVMIFSAIIFLIQFVVIPFVYTFVFDPNSIYTSFFVGIPLLLLMSTTTLGLYKLIFVLIDQKYYEFEFSQILPRFRNVYRVAIIGFFVAALLVFYKIGLNQLDGQNHTLAVVINIVSVLVSFYIALRLQFMFCFILDDDSTIRESMLQSIELTKNNTWNMFLLFVLVTGFIALGFVVFVVGIIFTYPFVNILLVVTYRRLIYSRQDVDDHVTELY